jgi:hypothetical protein
MGYEVVYKFYERDEEGDYNKNIEKKLKVEVGGPFEDVPREKLVSAIMSQMARRDILIFDVDIWELKKTKISFKETKGGIILGTKKYTFDGVNLVFQEIKEATVVVPPKTGNGMIVAASEMPQLAPNKMNMVPAVRNTRPMKWVTLDPDEPNLAKIRGSGLAFKPDKRYPVFNEMPHPKQLGVMIYTIIDDNEREVSVMDTYFLNADQILQRGFSSSVDRIENPRLSYGAEHELDIPDIRRR